MYIVLIVIFAILLIAGIGICFVGQRTAYDENYSSVGVVVAGVSAIVLGCCIYGMVNCCADVATAHTLQEKITMYEQENAAIEEKLLFAVNNYMDYEKDVLASLTPENAANALVLCPELQSDTVVMAQINTYLANSEKIKELKEEQIDISVSQWWINFGS